MRVDPEEYQRLNLRAHHLLADVPLHDVWAIDLPGDGTNHTIVDLRSLLFPAAYYLSCGVTSHTCGLVAW